MRQTIILLMRAIRGLPLIDQEKRRQNLHRAILEEDAKRALGVMSRGPRTIFEALEAVYRGHSDD